VHYRLATVLRRNIVNFRKTHTRILVVSVHFTGFEPPENDLTVHLDMGSQLQACVTMQSAFWPSSKKNGGEEGDKT